MIKSSIEEVSSYSASWDSSLSQITAGLTITRDEQTTVSGNREAHRSISAVGSSLVQLSSSFSSFSTNLHTIAESFRQADEDMANQIENGHGGTI